MNLTHAISDYLDGLANTRLALRSPSVLVPFAAFAAAQCAIILLLAWFYARPLAPFMVPVVERLGGPEALHYPVHLVRLPDMFRVIYQPLVATVGFALWSWAVWLMADRHARGHLRARPGFARALPQVVAVGVLFVGVSVGIGYGVAAATADVRSAMLQRGVVMGGMLLTALAQTFLVYAPVVLRLRGGNAWTALRASASFAGKNFLPTLLVVATVVAVHAPLDFILAQAHRVAFRFHPETIMQLLVASAVLEMLTAYLLFAATTELALREDGGMR